MVEYSGRTALIVVDVQNDFADPAGSLYVPGGSDVVADCDRGRMRGAARPALWSSTPRTGTRRRRPHFAKDGGIWPVHCVRDTWGAEFAPGLESDGPVCARASAARTATPASAMRDPRERRRPGPRNSMRS